METAYIIIPLGTAKISGDESGIAAGSIREEGEITTKILKEFKKEITQLHYCFEVTSKRIETGNKCKSILTKSSFFN